MSFLLSFSIFRYNCRSHPNNIKYLFHSKFSDESFIVYPSTAVAIIYDLKSKIQFFCLGHKSEITLQFILIHKLLQLLIVFIDSYLDTK
jgi:hypothetical protein